MFSDVNPVAAIKSFSFHHFLLFFVNMCFLLQQPEIAHRVEGGGGAEVWQEAHVQQLEEEALILDAVHAVQEEHHGGLVVRTETRRHVGLRHRAV